MKGPIWRGGKLTTAITWRPDQFLWGIVMGNLGRALPDPDLRSEIDHQLDRRLARFGKGLGIQHRSGANIDLQKIGKLDLGHDRLLGPKRCSAKWWLIDE